MTSNREQGDAPSVRAADARPTLPLDLSNLRMLAQAAIAASGGNWSIGREIHKHWRGQVCADTHRGREVVFTGSREQPERAVLNAAFAAAANPQVVLALLERMQATEQHLKKLHAQVQALTQQAPASTGTQDVAQATQPTPAADTWLEYVWPKEWGPVDTALAT